MQFDSHTDAYEYGIGTALVQKAEEGERPVAFASRLLSATERNYSITEKECHALVWAMKQFPCYIWGMTLRAVTDHHALFWYEEGSGWKISQLGPVGTGLRTVIDVQNWKITQGCGRIIAVPSRNRRRGRGERVTTVLPASTTCAVSHTQ